MARTKEELRVHQKTSGKWQAIQRVVIFHETMEDSEVMLTHAGFPTQTTAIGDSREEAVERVKAKTAQIVSDFLRRQVFTYPTTVPPEIDSEAKANYELLKLLPKVKTILRFYPNLVGLITMNEWIPQDQYLSRLSPDGIEDEIAPPQAGQSTATLNELVTTLICSNKITTNPATRRNYHATLRNYLMVKVHPDQEKPFGELEIGEIKTSMVESFRDLLLATRRAERGEWLFEEGDYSLPKLKKKEWIDVYPRSAQTVKHVLNLIKAAFAFGIADETRDWGVLRNPAEKVKVKINKDYTLGEIVTMDEYKSLIEACDAAGDIRLACYLALIRNCVRPSEIMPLTAADFDAKSGRLVVDKTMTARHELKKGGKTGSKNEVTIIKSDREIIERCIALGGNYIVPSYTDLTKPINVGSVKKPWRRIKKLAGITKDVSPYDMKHATISYLVGLGKSDTQILSMTRHTTPDMIRRHYNRRTGAELAETIK